MCGMFKLKEGWAKSRFSEDFFFNSNDNKINVKSRIRFKQITDSKTETSGPVNFII